MGERLVHIPVLASNLTGFERVGIHRRSLIVELKNIDGDIFRFGILLYIQTLF